MDSSQLLLGVGFFIIALIYSTVGFGGGSSYLALLAQPFFLLGQSEIRPTALLCNIVVVTGGTYIFYREGKIDLKKNWPFVLASVPMAFLGGYWKISDTTFFLLLGFTLLAASALLWFQPSSSKQYRSENTSLNLGVGGGVGFLSGLVGIGGGIFLAPILHLMNWDDAKKIAALASIFILANSISGLLGVVANDVKINWTFVIPLLASVAVGGQIGSRLGAQKFNPMIIKRITAVLIFLAAINILRDHL
jgi:uncharacterized membrane protein YfcA